MKKYFSFFALFAFAALFAVGPPAHASDSHQGSFEHFIDTNTDTDLSIVANPHDGDVRQHGRSVNGFSGRPKIENIDLNSFGKTVNGGDATASGSIVINQHTLI